MKHLQLNDKGIEVSKIQLLLNSNLTPSPSLQVSGVFEKRTEQAVKTFQKMNRIASNGVVEASTRKALGLKPSSTPIVKILTPAAPWMEIAIAELGVVTDTLPGKHNKRIIEYHKTTTLKATDDETAWCSSFVNWVLKQAGYTGTNSAAAKSWVTWGVAVDTPTTGNVIVIKQKIKPGTNQATGSTSGYHVGFFISKSDKYITILGGNQTHQVKYSNFKVSSFDVIAYRKPK